MNRFHFEFYISGEGILPEATPAGELADAIRSLEISIIETGVGQKIELPSEEALVSLVGIHEGSNRLTLSIIVPLIAAAGTISQAIETGDFSVLPTKAHKELYKMSQQAEKQKWEFHFVEDSTQQIRPATISAAHPVPAPDLPPLRGTTILYGRCLRVGGVEPHAQIRDLGSGKILYVHVDEPMARTLARCLYEEVALEGEASWDPESWEITEFRAIRLTDYRQTSPLMAFRELAAAAGGRWDDVDALEYVRDIRSTGTDT